MRDAILSAMGRSASRRAVRSSSGSAAANAVDHRVARLEHAAERLAALGEQGHEPGAPVRVGLAPADVAELDEPVDAARHRGERHREPLRRGP